MAELLRYPEDPITPSRAASIKFHRLKSQWLKERPRSSRLRDLVLSVPYQQIIGMGREAVPFLLHELQTAPDHWFWALEMITCVDPVPDEARGDADRMTEAWLQWAANNEW